MYPATHAATVPERPALVMAASGASISYRELDDRSARLAALLREHGLRPGDTVLLALENDLRWAEILWACLRSGLYLAAVNRHLGAAELTPMVEDAAPAAVVTSRSLVGEVRAATTAAALGRPPTFLVVGPPAADTAGGEPGPGELDYDRELARTARDPLLVETMGGRLLFSSGTTGRPKPFRVAPVDRHPADVPVRSAELMRSLDFGDGSGPPDVLLATGPAYHAGPLGFFQSVHQLGGTVVLMERFDAEGALAAIERYGVTHSQWVPTMFVRLLRLPAEVRARYDMSSHRVAFHGAAPCPPEVKHAMLDWWGPIVHEYYGASEGYGRTSIGPQEWLAHPGSVGRAVGGRVHVLDGEGRPLPAGEVGTVWFEKPGAEVPVRAADGSATLTGLRGWGTVGDLGRLDPDGYLHLTGRIGQTIISGGVNIYPREIEDVLALHPAVGDVAVLGVADPEFGERVTAVVQPVGDVVAGPELAAELIDYCRARLAHFKCPRSVDFVDRLPRSDAGKIQLEPLRARYRQAAPTR